MAFCITQLIDKNLETAQLCKLQRVKSCFSWAAAQRSTKTARILP